MVGKDQNKERGQPKEENRSQNQSDNNDDKEGLEEATHWKDVCIYTYMNIYVCMCIHVYNSNLFINMIICLFI
jgi:hypothetical protein